MTRTTLSFFATALAFSGFSQLTAQEPPKLLRIVREDIKQGKDAAHEKVESGYARAFSKAKYANYFALVPITGPNETWFVEAYDSYASLENMIHLADREPLKTELAALEVQDSDLRNNNRSLTAMLQQDLSYPGKPIPGGMSKFRYFAIQTVRIRPGRIQDYTDWLKMQHAALDKMNMTQASAVFSVTSGAPGGTYLVFRPMASLKAMDPPPGAITIVQALGDNLTQYRKLQSEFMISTETSLYSINPKMSNPTKETIDGDPPFWAPKAAPAKKTTTP